MASDIAYGGNPREVTSRNERDLAGRGCVAVRRVRDVAGVALDEVTGEFVATNGGGSVVRFDAGSFELRRAAMRRFDGLRWDNHLAVSSSAA